MTVKHPPVTRRKRLDQLNLSQFRSPDTTPEQVILLETITDAAHNYLFFALSPGYGAQEFAAAYEYLFPAPGGRAVTVLGAGRRMRQGAAVGPRIEDHYSASGLEQFLPLNRFQDWLRRERQDIINDNRPMIEKTLNRLAAAL
jgi:hypothetical protein